MFNGSTKSLWSAQCTVNELPIDMRFKTVLLALLWYCDHEPNPRAMNAFIEVFNKQMKKLMYQGVKICNADGSTVTFLVVPLLFPVDTKARPILTNRTQFNGFYGCSWCYIHGEHIGSMSHCMMESDSEDRNHVKYLKEAEEAEKLNASNPVEKCKSILGVKGTTKLCEFQHIDCIWSCNYKYMHANVLGVGKQLWAEWTNPKSLIYLNLSARAKVDERLISVKRPKEMYRLPKFIKKKNAWKAADWLYWILFDSVPCLKGILPDNAFNSFMHFVNSMYIALSDEISNEDLMQCEIHFIQFVGESQKLYDKEFMTFNVHVLLHVAKNIRKSGPLWATSAFPHESNIGKLKKFVRGSNGVTDKIADFVIEATKLKNDISQMPENYCSIFCKDLFSPKKCLTNFCTSNENATLHVTRRYFEENKYQKCLYDKKVLQGTAYTRPRKTDDSVVKLKDGRFVRIVFFSLHDNNCLMTVQHLIVEALTVENITMRNIFVVKSIAHEVMNVSISEIAIKLVFLELTDCGDTYVCLPPSLRDVQ